MPSGNGNGDIQLSVGLDTKDATQQAKQLSKQINEALQSTGTPSNSKVENANVQMKKAQREAQTLIDKMNKLSGKQVYSEDWTLLNDDITKIGMKIDTLIDKEEKFRQLGGNVNSKGFQSMEYDIEKLNAELTELYSRREQMKAQGNIFQDASASQEYVKLNNQLNSVNDKMKVAILRQREAANSAAKVTDETKNTGKEIDKNNKKLKQMPTSMSDVSKATKSVFKNILRWGFGIRSTFILVRRLREAIKEGFTNLIDSRPTSELANQITRLKGSIATLKNAFAAAFSPIVTMALPYIQKLINMILSAVNAVGQFFAAITGHKTYTKAILQSGKAIGGSTKATKDNTKATKDNKKAKDEQLKQLASFDELNNLSAQHQEDLNDALEDEADAGGGAGLANMFEEVPVDPKVLKWLEKIKKAIKPIVDAFKKGFFKALGDWKSRLADIKKSYDSIKKSIKEIANDPKVKKAFSNMILANAEALGAMTGTFAKAGLIIAQSLLGGIAKGLKDNKNRIKRQLTEIFTVDAEWKNKISDFWYAISDIIDVFASDSMKGIVGHILGIVNEVFLNAWLLFEKLGRDLTGAATQWIVDNKDDIKQHLQDILDFSNEILGDTEDHVQQTFDTLQETYDTHIKPLLDDIGQGLSDIYTTWNELWEQSVKPALDEISQKFKEFMDTNQPKIDAIIENLGKLFDVLDKLWNQILVPLAQWSIEHLGPYVIDFIKIKIEGLMTTISGLLTLIESISEVVGGVCDAIVKISEGDWPGAWDSIKNSVINAVNGIVDYIKNELLPSLNDAVIAVQFISNPLGSVSSYIGSKVGEKVGKKIRSGVGHFASGGVIPPSASEHLALVGDNNSETEVISPLSTMKQAMIEALATANLGGSSGDIVIQIDGREVFRAVQTQNSQYKKQTGASAFV